MSKSQNNFIGIFEDIDTQIAKILQIHNDVALNFLRLLTNKSDKEFKVFTESCDWLKIKKTIVFEVLSLFNPTSKVSFAWNRTMILKNIRTIKFQEIKHYKLRDFLIHFGEISSNRDLKRMIENKAIRVDRKQIITADLDCINLRRNQIIQIGKKLKFRLE